MGSGGSCSRLGSHVAAVAESNRRPPRPREPIPEHLLEHNPRDQFELDEEKFLQNLRSAHRGVAGGPSA